MRSSQGVRWKRARYEFVNLIVQAVGEGSQVVTVAVCDLKEERYIQETQVGQGSIEAIYSAIDEMFAVEKRNLLEYRIDAVTEGIDSQAQVHVLVEFEGGVIKNGTGIDYDVLKASTKAYLQVIG